MSWRFTSMFWSLVVFFILMLVFSELFALAICGAYQKGYIEIAHAEVCHRPVVMIVITLPIDILSSFTRFIASFF